MGAIPDFWGRVLTAVLTLAGGVIGALITARISERRAARDAESGAGWRNRVLESIERLSGKLDAVTEAQHVAMRQQLSHSAEKYLTRGWWTEEERKAWWDMYNAYDALGKNGFMLAYWEQLTRLPSRSIEDVAGGFE